MSIHRIRQKLEDNGAACFWGRIEPVSAADGQPTVYRWVDEINDRDYLAKCVADGAYALWMPRYNVGNGGGIPSDLIQMAVPESGGGTYAGAQRGLSGSGGSPNWGRLIAPALLGQNIGFYGEGGSLSPLARRTNATQTWPVSNPEMTVPGSWTMANNEVLVAEQTGTTKIVDSFPFSLECWVKPTASNTGTDPTATDKPGCAIMIAPPNDPGSPADAHPQDGWQCWGVGFKADSSNPGVPVVFWGGWQGHDPLYQAGPDPGRTKYPTSSSNPSTAEWQHVVAVFHSATHVQLFWNGREVGNYNNNDFGSFRDQNGVNRAWSTRPASNPATYSYSAAPGLTAWVGGCTWFHVPGGLGITSENQFTMSGMFAYPAVYRKALSNREVMQHFLTCRQAANITLRGEAQDYSGSAPQGVLKVERTKVPGLGRTDQILIWKDQITTGQASMEMDPDGKAAIQQCALPDPFPYLSGVTDDRRYHDGNQGGFTGYCIAGAVGAIFDSSIATISNGFMAPMSWVGRPQWGVSSQELTTPTGMQVPIYSFTNSSTNRREAFIYADLQDPKNSGDRATGTVEIQAINSDKNSRLGTQVFSAKYEEGKILEVGTQDEPEIAQASSVSNVGTMRLADTSDNDGAWTFLTNVALAETPLVIGPHTLIGSPMPTQGVIRMLGGTPKLRSRQATTRGRRHNEINNMPAIARQAGEKNTGQAPSVPTTIGSLSISGPQTAAEDTATSWSVTRSGNAGSITWAWSSSPSASITAAGSSASITFPDPSVTYTVSVTATDSGASDSPVTTQQNITTKATIGTVTISGPTSGDEDTAQTFTAARSGTSNSITWTWSSSPSASIIPSGATASIVFPDPSVAYTITAQAVDSQASDTPKSDTHTFTTNAASTADWDTHQQGAGVLNRFDTDTVSVDYDHQFPLASGVYATLRGNPVGGGTAPYTYGFEGGYGNPGSQVQSPLYCAVWFSPEHEAAGGYAHNDDGWYVYKRNGYSDGTAEGGTPTSNGRAQYIPHAWPTGANNNDGRIGIGGSDTFPGFFVVMDDYTGTSGAGGTDSWTAPFDWSSPNYTATFTLVATGSSNFNLSNVSDSGPAADDWQAHTYQPMRGSSQQIFILWRLSTGGTFSDGNDFFADTKLQHARLRNTTSGSEFDLWDSPTSSVYDEAYAVRFGDSSGIEPFSSNPFYLRWLYNTGDGTAAYAKFSAGDTVQLDFFYTDDT
jgi:hypothetical protein